MERSLTTVFALMRPQIEFLDELKHAAREVTRIGRLDHLVLEIAPTSIKIRKKCFPA